MAIEINDVFKNLQAVNERYYLKAQKEINEIKYKANKLKDITELEEIYCKLFIKQYEPVNYSSTDEFLIFLENQKRYIDLATAISNFDKKEDVTYFSNILKEAAINLDSENFSVNQEKLKEYCYRVIDKGFYKRKDFEIKAIKQILNIKDSMKTKSDIIQLNKEILNQDFSVRYAMIIESLRGIGSKKEPVVINNKKTGAIVKKIGGACDEQDLVLFDFLLGQFLESNEGILQLVKREDLLDSLNMDRNKKRVDKMMLSLSNLASQVVLFDDDNATDKVKKELLKDKIIQKNVNNLKLKGINLFTYEAIEVDGLLTIQFQIPLVKYLGASNQFGRYIKADIMKHWSKKPRVYWIAKELAKLCRMNESNSKKAVSKNLTIETLLKNINDWDRYKKYKDKKTFIKRLNEDINLASSYLKNYKVVFHGCTVSTVKTSKITYL